MRVLFVPAAAPAPRSVCPEMIERLGRRHSMALGHDGYPIRDGDRVVCMTRPIDGHACFEVFCLDYWRTVRCHGSPGDLTFVLHAHGTGPLESDMFLDIEVLCAEDHSVFWKRVVNIQRAWRRHARARLAFVPLPS